ncbi:hypothetical protein LXL04_027763 [Taraxacum kok-saghyz]
MLVQMRTIIEIENRRNKYGQLNHIMVIRISLCHYDLDHLRIRSKGPGCAILPHNNWSRSFENSYIPENSQTVKLFEKPTSGGLKIAQIQVRSLYNTYLNGFSSEVGFFERNNGLRDIGNWGSSRRERERESGFFLELIYSLEPENSQTVNFFEKPISGAKNRSNTSPVAKKKMHIFSFISFAYVYISCFCFKNAQIPEIFLKFFIELHICKKNLKNIVFSEKKIPANYNYYERFKGSRIRFFEMNNGLLDIGNWGSSQTASKLCGLDILLYGVKGAKGHNCPKELLFKRFVQVCEVDGKENGQKNEAERAVEHLSKMPQSKLVYQSKLYALCVEKIDSRSRMVRDCNLSTLKKASPIVDALIAPSPCVRHTAKNSVDSNFSSHGVTNCCCIHSQIKAQIHHLYITYGSDKLVSKKYVRLTFYVRNISTITAVKGFLVKGQNKQSADPRVPFFAPSIDRTCHMGVAVTSCCPNLLSLYLTLSCAYHVDATHNSGIKTSKS